MRNFFWILRNLKIRHSFYHTRDMFLAQENNLTLWGTKKLLEQFGVKVTAIHSPRKSLDDATYPFVCQTPDGLVAVTQEPKDLQAFMEMWDGYALLCDTSHAYEPYYLIHKIKDWLMMSLPWAATAGAVLTSLCFLCDEFSVAKLLLTLFTLLGLYFSYRSAVNECAGSCSVVTESPMGKIMGYSLSVIGLAYFGVSLLPALFVPSWMPLWSWIAVLSVLMPVWSIYNQAFVLHAWCKNCLVVMASVLLTAAVILVDGLPTEGVFQLQPLVALPSLYLLATYLLDKVFLYYKVAEHPPMDGTVLRLMHKEMLRNEILSSGREVDTSTVPDVWVVNKDAKEEVFLVLSLHCVHCKELFFKLYKELEKGNLNNYRIKLALNTAPAERKIINALASIGMHQDGRAALKLLAEWYEEQNMKLFMLKIKKNLPMEGVNDKLEEISEAIRIMGVKGLPFMALNGYEVTPTIFWAKRELEQ